MIEHNLLSDEKFIEILKADANDPNKLLARENSILEFKESYSYGNTATYLKAMASFANNKGGYIFFGIKDKPRKLLGLNQNSLQHFDEMDIDKFTGILCDYFIPEIEWQHHIFDFHEMKFGVIYVSELANKPCICKKNYDDKTSKYCLKEGDIYYRYRGKSERIHYSELINILNEQRNKESRAWMTHLEKILKAGPTNIATIDFTSMDLGLNDGSGFVLDKSLAKELLSKIKLVKEGNFSEIDGKPTLKLIGNLSISEEIPVPNIDINISYPYILKDISSQIGISSSDVRALLWKHSMKGDKKYNLSIDPSSKHAYPIQKYSQYALERLREIISQNEPDYVDRVRTEFHQAGKK